MPHVRQVEDNSGALLRDPFEQLASPPSATPESRQWGKPDRSYCSLIHSQPNSRSLAGSIGPRSPVQIPSAAKHRWDKPESIHRIECMPEGIDPPANFPADELDAFVPKLRSP